MLRLKGFIGAIRASRVTRAISWGLEKKKSERAICWSGRCVVVELLHGWVTRTCIFWDFGGLGDLESWRLRFEI